MSININERFEYWCKKLRITPQWDIKLEMIDDPNWQNAFCRNMARIRIFHMEGVRHVGALMNCMMDYRK